MKERNKPPSSRSTEWSGHPILSFEDAVFRANQWHVAFRYCPAAEDWNARCAASFCRDRVVPGDVILSVNGFQGQDRDRADENDETETATRKGAADDCEKPFFLGVVQSFFVFL